MCVYIYMYIHVYTYTYTFIYVYMHINTCMHITDRENECRYDNALRHRKIRFKPVTERYVLNLSQKDTFETCHRKIRFKHVDTERYVLNMSIS